MVRSPSTVAGLVGLLLLGACAGTRPPGRPSDRGLADSNPHWSDAGWTPAHDGPNRDGSNRDGPNRDGPNRDGPNRDGLNRDGPAPDSARDLPPVCVPACAGKLCGAADGCGGTCALGSGCCSPDCAGKACGPDGCGGVCATCPGSQVCQAGVCLCPEPITIDPSGCVAATCTGWPNPAVKLTWCGVPNQTTNAVQRGEGIPGQPTFGWQALWGDATLLLRAWTDTSVLPNTTYTYRIKFTPALPSSNVTVPVTACNCGG